MSLLLDALKRAEQEKLAKQGERPEPERTRREPPPMSAAAASAAAAAASLELQPINAGASAASRSAAERSRDAATAQTVFQAKGGAPGTRSRKGLALAIVLGVVVIVVAAAGVYVWLAVQSFSPRTAASARPRTIQSIATPAPSDPMPKLDTLIAPPQQPTAAIQPPSVPEARKEAPASAVREPRELVAALLRDAPAPSVTPPVRLAPTADKAHVPAEVAAGYEQLRNGDLAAAKRSYAAAIASDPANIDAQLGAATIEARAGNRMLAASHYRRALDLDPHNGTAIAGLASIADYAQPEGLESQLRGEIQRNPQSPQLHFTLGNLYAGQSRWNEAQVEFFEAHRLDPASADILYNLAVSLDHIGQPRLAAEQYRRALDAARGEATQFDPATVSRRLAQLKP